MSPIRGPTPTSRSNRCSACASRRRCSACSAAQSFWVTVALLIICLVMGYLQPASFATSENFYNITRNFSFIGIMALGMTAVIATGGIDLSVGSIMGVAAVVCGLTLEAGVSLVGGGRRSGWRRADSSRLVNGYHHRLCRPVAVRDDARHAVDRPLLRGGAFGQPHALPVRRRRGGVQDARRRRARHRRHRSSSPIPCCS